MPTRTVPQDENDKYTFSGFLNLHKDLLTASTSDDLTKIYDAWPEGLDKLMADVEYGAPAHLASYISKYEANKEAKILDVGAGTGLVAEQLLKCGFSGNFDGLDPSIELGKKAMEKKLYKKFFNDYVTEEPCSIPSASYDHVAACGAVVPGHIKYQAISELLRMVKIGGRLFLCFRKDYLQDDEFVGIDEYFTKMEENGLANVERFDFKGYYSDYTGHIVVVQKLKEN